MEKALFDQLLLNYSALDSNEAVQVEQLSRQFPYSQVLHLMAARAAQDNSLANREALLHTSAIYSTDRSVLKSIMVSPPKVRSLSFPGTSQSSSEHETKLQPVVESGESIYQQVEEDLAKLQESKRQFELTIERIENEKLHPLVESKEMGAVFESLNNPDDLIQEIKTTKKKIKPEGEKQKEQIEIIDQFIKTRPTVAKPAKTITSSIDLAEGSANLNENIVSETLVEILLKQGKKEKAIEVLKKLIWKFPQKKAYFAAQIEDLKK